MPELPEVETVCRGLRAAIGGRVIARVHQRRPDLRRPFPRGFVKRLTGRRVEAIDRRGKYLLIRLDDGVVLIVHLGMSGRMVVGARRNRFDTHDHVVFETADGLDVVFNDPRRFGLMDLVEADRLDRHKLLRGMGPEPLDAAFTPAVLGAALAGRKTAIKAALLDQRIVAGLGNIYVCEALFRAGISPRRRAGTVGPAQAGRLVPAIKNVLDDAIAAGGSSLKDYVQTDGELGYFQHRFAVYDREGKPCPGCRCGGSVKRIVQGGRSTFFCPNRQR